MHVSHRCLWIIFPVLAAAFPAGAVAQLTKPAKSTSGALKINFSHDTIKPNAAQTAAIEHAAASDMADFIHPERGGYSVAQADLNDDGHPDLLVHYDDISFCGSSGCSGMIIMATARGYARTGIDLPNFGYQITVFPASHHGMRDLQYDGDSPIWKWNGKDYDVDPADVPGANAPPWVTRQAAGHPLMAVATPIDSTIKNLLVFCEQNAPLLAMVTTSPRPPGPVTLTFVFRGWAVNLPLQGNASSATLWVADLSRSDLPEWLAHRGSTPTTRELARLADTAYLRINGATEGQISLANSTATTGAALAACYHD